jgi:hypothetical protein
MKLMKMKGKAIVAAVIAVIVVGAGAYYLLDSGGNLSIQIKDPMPAGWTAVYINISEVSIHNSTAGGHNGYSKSFTPAYELNLSNATKGSIFLTSLSLPAGHYQMIRLVVNSAFGVYEGKTYRITLTSPNIDIAGQFRISSGATTTVTLDFNSAQAIHGTPFTGFTMTPVVAESVS